VATTEPSGARMTDDDARRGMILNVSDRGARKSAVTAAPRVTGEFQSVVLRASLVDTGASILGRRLQASTRCRSEQVGPPTCFRLRPRQPQHPDTHSHIHVPIRATGERVWIGPNQRLRAPPEPLHRTLRRDSAIRLALLERRTASSAECCSPRSPVAPRRAE
jgi:hypothetical protein